jgi:UDP-2,3-diacylglucosamine hydrolase
LAHKAQPASVALFVSDLHLHPSLPKTTQAFLDFLQRRVLHATSLYLLGDVFEYWAGDDDIDAPLHRTIVKAIRQVSDAGVQVFWMAGNRDFLVSQDFAAAAGLSLLPDPTVITIAGHRIVLAHGDAQCTDDTAYMAFRAQVRDAAWQHNFLRQPLAQRKHIIEGLRDQSRAAQRSKSMTIMDVNDDAITALFRQAGATTMIHGHTHRPGRHTHVVDGRHCTRYVLPDWDCDAEHPRGGWISMSGDGVLRRHDFHGGELTWAAPAKHA